MILLNRRSQIAGVGFYMLTILSKLHSMQISAADR